MIKIIRIVKTHEYTGIFLIPLRLIDRFDIILWVIFQRMGGDMYVRYEKAFFILEKYFKKYNIPQWKLNNLKVLDE